MLCAAGCTVYWWNVVFHLSIWPPWHQSSELCTAKTSIVLVCHTFNNMNASVPRLGYLLAGNALDKSPDIFRFYPYDNPLVPYLPVYLGATTHSYIVTLLNIPRSPPATARPRSHVTFNIRYYGPEPGAWQRSSISRGKAGPSRGRQDASLLMAAGWNTANLL